MKRTLQWHPAFQAAMRIELAQEADKLQFLKEFNLTNGPLRVDTLVIKADRGVRIQKRIGRIFRQYNILAFSYTHLDVYKRQALSHAVELILMITEKSVFYFMAGWEPRDAIQAAAGTQYQILEKGIVKEHSAE